MMMMLEIKSENANSKGKSMFFFDRESYVDWKELAESGVN